MRNFSIFKSETNRILDKNFRISDFSQSPDDGDIMVYDKENKQWKFKQVGNNEIVQELINFEGSGTPQREIKAVTPDEVYLTWNYDQSYLNIIKFSNHVQVAGIISFDPNAITDFSVSQPFDIIISYAPNEDHAGLFPDFIDATGNGVARLSGSANINIKETSNPWQINGIRLEDFDVSTFKNFRFDIIANFTSFVQAQTVTLKVGFNFTYPINN